MTAVEKRWGQKFTPLETAILQAAWTQDSYRTVAQNLYLTEGHVKDVASDLWKRLTGAVGIKLSKRTFRGLMEQRVSAKGGAHPVIPMVLKTVRRSSVSWADAPAVDRFYGRETEQHTLKQWLVGDRCRLVTVVGLGGIGKTALATTVARAITGEFAVVIWRSLINAPPIETLLKQLLTWIEQATESPLPTAKDFDSQLLALLTGLQNHRCLVVLDNVETVLASQSPYRPGYERYDQLFRRLGEASHQSCLLLTSREKPPAIARLDRRPNSPIRTLSLSGLSPSTSRDLLAGLQPFEASPDSWHQLTDQYQGHPLVLELVAKHIDEAFFGDVEAFLSQEQRLFNDLENLLQWHFKRLSSPEQLLLFWLAVYRHPVSLTQLQTAWRHPQPLGNILQTLQRRLPLVRHPRAIALQPVLLEYVTERLVTDLSHALLQGDLETLDSVCLLQASAPDDRRAIQRRLILTAVGDRGLTQLTNPQLTDHCFELLEQFRRSPHQGYGAGNLVNLLIVLGADLRQQNFSSLTLREVDLQGTILHHSNFSHSHFDRVALTQPIQAILSVATSADDRWFAAGNSDGSIQIYDAHTTDQSQTLGDRHSQAWVYGLALNNTGSILMSGSTDKIVRVWDCSMGQRLQQHPCESQALNIAFDGVHHRWITGHINGQVQVWATQDDGQPKMDQPLLEWTAHGSAMGAMVLSTDGRSLVTGSDRGNLRLWDPTTGQLRQEFPPQGTRVQAIAINITGDTLATVGDNHAILLWDSHTGQQRRSLQGHGAAVKALQFHNTEPWLISVAYDNTVRVWEIPTGHYIQVLLSGGSQRLDVMAVAGDRLMVGGKDQTLQFGDVRTGKWGRSLQGFVCGTKALAFANGGKTLLSSGLDRYIWQWDLATPASSPQFWSGHPSNVWTLAISPEHPQPRLVGSGDYTGGVTLWNLDTQQPLHTWTAHTDVVRAIAFSPVHPWMATASVDGLIKIWDTATGECLQTLGGHRGMVQTLEFLPQGDRLISSGNDGTLRLWDGITGQLLNTWIASDDAIYALAFHPTLPLVVTGDRQGLIKLWHWKQQECLAIAPGHKNLIWSVAISPDGHWIASSSQDQTLRLWQLNPQANTLTATATFPHHTAVGAVAFDPTGKTLVCGCFDRTLHSYNLATQQRDRTLTIPRPYEAISLQGATGLNLNQRTTLQQLGAIL